MRQKEYVAERASFRELLKVRKKTETERKKTEIEREKTKIERKKTEIERNKTETERKIDCEKQRVRRREELDDR